MDIKICFLFMLIAFCLTRDVLAVPERCLPKPETGMCKAYIKMYAYKSNIGKCEEFVYGGCDGNDNRFSTKKECENTCINNYEEEVNSNN